MPPPQQQSQDYTPSQFERGAKGVATGLSYASDLTAPMPGNQTVDTTSWSQNDWAQFMQSLMNSSSQTSNTNLTNTAAEGGSSQQYNLDPQTQALLNQLTQQFSASSKPVDLRGYQANAIQGINRNSDLQSEAVNNIMAARGLSTSPVTGASLGNVDAQRFAQINQLNNSIPLLQRDMNQQNLTAAGNFFTQIPKNTNTTNYNTGQVSQAGQSNTDTTQSNTQSSNGTQTTNQTSRQETKVPKRGILSTILGGLGAASGVAAAFSDERLKKDISPIDKATEKIMALKPVDWEWKDANYSSSKDSSKRDSGVLAQDLEKVLPNLVHNDPAGSGYKKVNYAGIIPYLVGAVQDLNTRVGVEVNEGAK